MGAKPRVEPQVAPDLGDPDLAGPPLEWATSIQGYLMLFPRAVAETWRGYERGTSPAREPVVDGVVARHGDALVLLGAANARLIADGDRVLAVLAGPAPDDALAVAARAARAAGDWTDTGAHIDATGGGLVIFDGSAPWAMVAGGLHVALEVDAPRYRVSHRALDGGHALRLEPQ